MVTYTDLPNEILNNIFKRLSTKDTMQCCLSCHVWKTAAQRVLFETIQLLNEEKLNVLSSALSVYQDGLPCAVSKHSPGNFVKVLDCSELGDNIDSSSSDELFPLLEVIKIKSTQQSFYDELYKLMVNGRFPNLKSIPCVIWNGAHAELVLNRKDNIEQLQLQAIPPVDDVTYRIMQNLHLFSRLEELEVQYRDEQKEICLETLFSQNYSHLKSIILQFSLPSKLTLNTSLVDLDAIQPLSGVKCFVSSVHYRFFNSGDTSYLYIMKKIPDVEKLELQCTATNVLKIVDITAPTVSCIDRFLKYFFNVKTRALVGPIVTDQLTNKIVENYFNYANTQRSFSSKEIILDLRIVFDWVILREEGNYAQNRTTYMEVFNNNFRRKKLCVVKLVYKLTNPVLRYLESYLKLLQKVKNMNISNLTVGDNGGDFIIPPGVTVNLYPILSILRQLKNLRLCRIVDLVFFEEEQESWSSSVESLSISTCYLPKEIFPTISSKCPSLKVLQFNSCTFISQDPTPESPRIPRIVPIIMLSTRLKELNLYISMRGNIEMMGFDKAFVRLKTTNKKTRYCKIVMISYPSKIDYLDAECTEANYEICLEDERCIIYDIQCEAVQRLTVASQEDDDDEVDDSDDWRNRVYLEEDL